jgi:SAM-dependent methyltransferase
MSKQEFYDRIYKKNPHKWEIAEYDRLAFDVLNEYLGGEPPKNLLDVGCGNGHTLEYFARHWPEVAYSGLELSGEAIRLARRRIPEASFIQGNFEETIFPNKYDCITLLGVIEHFEDLAKNLEKLRRIMAVDCICYIEAPNCIDYPKSAHEEGFRETNSGSHQEEWHLFRSTWESILINAGFEILAALKGINLQTEFVWLVR